jgi:hypothetical protein
MEIRPLDDNGLLFFVERPGASFVSLTLYSGNLELKILSSNRFSTVPTHTFLTYVMLSDKNKIAINEPTTLASTKMLVKGIWYKVQFGIFGKKVYLSVDNVFNSGVLSTENGINISRETIFIGLYNFKQIMLICE